MTPVESQSENSKSSKSEKSGGSKKKKGADKRSFFQGKQANSSNQFQVSTLNSSSGMTAPSQPKRQVTHNANSASKIKSSDACLMGGE